MSTIMCANIDCSSHAHRSTSAPEFLSGEGGDPTVTAKFDVPNGACAELLLPVGFPLLQLFADSGARLGFAVNGTSLTLKANGGGTVYSNDALDLDSLNLFSDGYVCVFG